MLAEEGLETWDGRRIDGGDDWLPEIEGAIAQCDVALLLISANFLFRDKTELAKAQVLIEQCEYFRRLPELEDAEAALGTVP